MYWKPLTSVMTIAVAVASPATDSFAQERSPASHQHGEHNRAAMNNGPNGGTIQMVGSHRVDTVVMPKGVMFMILDAKGQTLAAPNASGSLKLRIGDGTKEYLYELKSLKNGSIGVAVDLSKVVGHTLHMDVLLNGLTGEPISFHAMGKVDDGRLSDDLLISLQETCPVSGKKLGSMGAPLKVDVKRQSRLHLLHWLRQEVACSTRRVSCKA